MKLAGIVSIVVFLIGLAWFTTPLLITYVEEEYDDTQIGQSILKSVEELEEFDIEDVFKLIERVVSLLMVIGGALMLYVNIYKEWAEAKKANSPPKRRRPPTKKDND